MSRFIVLVIDGLGIGAQEDADQYGDSNADTLGHVTGVTGVRLPKFEQLGMGNIRPLASIPETDRPLASWGKMREVSPGKDSTTGHWELAGIHLGRPFPTFPNGFPEPVVRAFCEGIGVEKVLCNRPYSGTNVIADYGEEHLKTGYPILYTSADSVFQVACHVDVANVETQYKWCKFARHNVAVGDAEVGRVIARPFEGKPGEFERLSGQRKDFSSIPPEPNLLSLLQDNQIKTYSIGKVIDLFAGNHFTQYRKTKSNAEGLSQLLSLLSAGIDQSFIFANLIDTDQLFGHRQDPDGYASCLEEIDRALPAILGKLTENDVLVITGDHGNDPADDSTDHTREFVPLLVYQKTSEAKDIGVRETFSDVAASVLSYFTIHNKLPGDSFI
ncbi:phosphopentomutase [Rhodohalobacter sp. 8-1]|uniref:phosphopentomutase n=1 Tax=Rhodohalobacter sp. 8-1 TaxID=3131972 RepID=UPI0030EB3B4C